MRFMQVCFGATIASFPFAFSYGVEIFSSATNTELEEEDFEDDDVSDTIDNNNNTYHCDEKKENEKHNGDQTGYISATLRDELRVRRNRRPTGGVVRQPAGESGGSNSRVVLGEFNERRFGSFGGVFRVAGC